MNGINWDAMDRYFSGEASPQEVDELARPESAKLVESVREIWDAAGLVSQTAAPDVDDAWRSVSRRLSERTTPTIVPFRRHSIPTRVRFWPVLLTASAAAAIGAFVLESQLDRTSKISSPPSERVFATRRAQRADVYLSDGTRVLLNVDSRLRVPATYDHAGASRDVTLEGEAQFNVVHDSLRPFRVHTQSGVVEDVGTVFTVTRYPEAPEMRVGVSSGAVRLWRTHDSTSAMAAGLKRGDLALIDSAGRVALRHNVDMENEAAWTTGRLVFDRVPLRDAIPRLARWFDADIRLADSKLAVVRYTGSFTNERVDHVLDLLAASLDARVSKTQTANSLLPPTFTIYTAPTNPVP
jgi:ferric-dicitrate binding protein FerR (iron transport regulator)